MMKIKCGNEFCIYFENGSCILDSVSLDEMGICEEILLISAEEKWLAEKRKELLEKFEQLEYGQ